MTSDLTTKAAEIRAGLVKPLVWDLSGMDRGYPAKAESIFGTYSAWEIDDGYWKAPEAHCGRRASVGLQSALDSAQSDYEARILSALNLDGFQKQAGLIASQDDVIKALLAEKPFWFDPATNFVHADDGGGRGTRWDLVPEQPALPAGVAEAGLIEKLKFESECWASSALGDVQDGAKLMTEAADLIEQQAAELAEARAEIKRLKADVGFAVGTANEYSQAADDWRRRATTAESERDELLREKERLGAALKPFAQAAADCDVVDDLRIGVVKPADVIWESAPAVSITFGHLAAAQSALENGPAGPADAHSKSPAPSSQSERIAVLEARLKPFADYITDREARLGFREADDERMLRGVTIGDFRRARAALAPLGEE